MNYIIFFLVLAVILTVTVLTQLSRKRKKTKWVAKAKAQWGQPIDDYRNFERVSIYHNLIDKEDCFQVIDQKVADDLDLDEVFTYLDRTNSRVGQQYLYHMLRTPTNDLARLNAFDNLIISLQDNEDKRLEAQYTLSALNGNEAYHLPDLFLGDLPAKPGWLWITKTLPIINVGLIVAAFFQPTLLIMLVPTFLVNLILHYVNKRRIGKYTGSFLRLNSLVSVGKRLFDLGMLGVDLPEWKGNFKVVSSMKKRIGWISTESWQDNEAASLAWIALEYFKILFLLEFNTFYTVLDQLKQKKKEIQYLYEAIGRLDAAISIASFRKGLSSYTKPAFTDQKMLSLSNMKHPLIVDCVPSTIEVEDKGVLITGSNMAGKTTFIRTVAVNCILAQTIYTALADQFSLPFLRVFSSIRIADDLEDQKSYYMEEVFRVGELLERSQDDQSFNLFVIDEVFKGTNTIERVAAAKGILSQLNNANCFVFVSSHDLELTQLLADQYDLYHFREMVNSDGLAFDYQLRDGIPTSKNAIKILEISGYPSEVIEEAKRMAEMLEQDKNKKN
ncbi:MAG: hypothetical protein AAFX87_24460 [Bacteroidota bacterium]